jgi:hypothetical protein
MPGTERSGMDGDMTPQAERILASPMVNAHLYLVAVRVRYELVGFAPKTCLWLVIIGALNPDRAVEGAIEWTRGQRPEIVLSGAKPVFLSANVAYVLSEVDCVGVSIVEGQ